MVIRNELISLKTLVSDLGPLIAGTLENIENSTITINGVANPQDASESDIVFVTKPNYLDAAFASRASVICILAKLREATATRSDCHTKKAILFSHEPERAMRETVHRYFLPTPYINREHTELIHATAIIHPEAKLASGVRIGAYSVIAKGVAIGADSVVAPHCVIETDTVIGARSVIHPFVYIGHSTVIGNDCEIHSHSAVGKEGFGYTHDAKFNHYRIPHQGRVIIEDRVHLGASNTIDRGKFEDTIIRAGSVLDNRIHIAHNCTVGENSVITCGLVVAGSTHIGRNFVTGGNVSMTGHIEVCDNVQLAGASCVRKSITKPGAYGGNPLLPLREASRALVGISKLPEIMRALKLKNLKRLRDDDLTAQP